MQAVGQRIVDRVNVRVSEQIAVGLMNTRDMMFARKSLGAFWVPRRYGDDFNFGYVPGRIGQSIWDNSSCPKDTHTDRSRFIHCVFEERSFTELTIRSVTAFGSTNI